MTHTASDVPAQAVRGAVNASSRSKRGIYASCARDASAPVVQGGGIQRQRRSCDDRPVPNFATGLLAVSLHFARTGSDVLGVQTVERTMRADRVERAAVNQQRSLEAFLAVKAFDAQVAELQAMSAEHFGADPEAVLWGHAASLADWTRRLRAVTDACHRRGECAPG
jgi:hypothetical protein